MANHKMTGKGGDAKSSLDPKELEEIIAATKERYPNSKLSDIRLAIRYKLNNESKKYAASLAKKKSKNWSELLVLFLRYSSFDSII